MATFIDPGLTLAAAYMLFIIILLVRPEGLFEALVLTGGETTLRPDGGALARAARSFRTTLALSARDKRHLAVAALLFAAASLLPFSGSGYWLSLGVSIAMFTVLATSWTLFSGPTNYISATAAFFGVGMYIVAAGLDYLPYPALIVIAAIAGALFA